LLIAPLGAREQTNERRGRLNIRSWIDSEGGGGAQKGAPVLFSAHLRRIPTGLGVFYVLLFLLNPLVLVANEHLWRFGRRAP